MTPELQAFLRRLVELRRQQPADSPYFDPTTGGTYSSKLSGMTGLTYQEVETYAAELEAMGYAKVLVRDSNQIHKGVFVTDAGVLFVEGVEAQEKQAAAAKAVVDAQKAYDLEVTNIVTRARELNLI